MNLELNELSLSIIEEVVESPDHFRIIAHESAGTGLLLDFGVEAEGSLEAGQVLSTVCMAGLATVNLQPQLLGKWQWPHVVVETDYPVAACLYSQYAGWQLSSGKFHAMGSGPMRAAAGVEPLFDKLWYKEEADHVVGILETAMLPPESIFEEISAKTGVEPADITLLIAPTSSVAGNYQVAARSVETAMHKLLELGFDVHRIRSGFGSAPLPPVAANDLQGIGRTNDAILYGSTVTLLMTGDDASIAEILPQVPSKSSSVFGKTFLEIFEAAGRDFYKIDKLLFSPAQVIVQNVDTGRVHVAGEPHVPLVLKSFGLVTE